eukprot:gnl/TRDRNA2_/TRDRNA2_8931_c0_seq1.p1 gnl/TRDRNA2_/TRDRNA2_8931_c0~~gnl/TRDRNA2_/TRDRNA2_8931_c0_seq1.p1  ORF type:complete len:120 (-),score=7.57 gnl/TRDRNA2_/TRDRNA2_8931_c0_seq1:78-437(-)
MSGPASVPPPPPAVHPATPRLPLEHVGKLKVPSITDISSLVASVRILKVQVLTVQEYLGMHEATAKSTPRELDRSSSPAISKDPVMLAKSVKQEKRVHVEEPDEHMMSPRGAASIAMPT